MKNLKRVFLVLVLVLVGLCSACGLFDSGMSAEEAIKSIVLENTKELTADFTVPTEVEGFKGTITWTSDSEDVIKVEGNVAKVTCPEFTNGALVMVKLTVTATNGDDTYSKTISVTVKQKEQDLASAFAETFTVEALGSVISKNFVLPVSDTINEQNVTISWASDSAAIVVDAQGNATVTRPASSAEGNASVKLTATITVNGATTTKEFTATVLKEIYQELGEPISAAPVAGTSYKWGMVQTANGAVYYFTGEMNQYYGATSTEAALGVDVYVEVVEGGYHIYFNNASGKKQYVNGQLSDDGQHLNFVFGDTATSVWTWNETCNSLVTKIGDKTCFPGTYGTYYTFGMCDMAKWDASSNYAGQFYVNDGSLSKPEMPEIYPIMTQPEVGVGYRFGIAQTSVLKLLYFTGVMSGYYGGASTSADEAVLVYLEAAEGGYYLTFTVDGTKNYLNLVQSGTYTNVKFETTASTVWVWNSQYETLTTKLGSDDYYLGTYASNETFGASKLSYAATSFVAHFYAADAAEITDAERLERAEHDLEKLETSYNGKDNLELPETLYGTTITWATSDASIMTDKGVVTHGVEDQTVTLTATITLEGQENKTVELVLTVKQISSSTLKNVAKAAIEANGEEVLVKFVAKIIGTSSEKFIFADETGVLYAYAYANKFAAGAKTGDVLEVVAKVKVYNSLVELYYVVNSNILTDVEVTPINPVAANSKDFVALGTTESNDFQGNDKVFALSFHNKLVKVTGQVVESVEGENTYYYLQVNEQNISVKGLDISSYAGDGKTYTLTALLGEYNSKYGYYTAYAYGAEGEFVEYVEGEGGETPEPTVQSETITFDNVNKRTEQTASTQVWKEGNITVTNNKAGSTSNVADYSNPARFYKSSELIIASEYEIKTIVVTANSASYATALKDSITSGATVTVEGAVVTITLDTPATSFTIASLSAGQVRVDSITVNYK